MNKFFCTKTRVLLHLVAPSEKGMSQLYYNWVKIGMFQPNFDKKYCFSLHSQAFDEEMLQENDLLVFFQSVHFEFEDSLQNNGTKHVLFSEKSSEEMCD